jgi:hypothetical protein
LRAEVSWLTFCPWKVVLRYPRLEQTRNACSHRAGTALITRVELPPTKKERSDRLIQNSDESLHLVLSGPEYTESRSENKQHCGSNYGPFSVAVVCVASPAPAIEFIPLLISPSARRRQCVYRSVSLFHLGFFNSETVPVAAALICTFMIRKPYSQGLAMFEVSITPGLLPSI